MEHDDKGVLLQRQDAFHGLTEPERPKPVLPAGVVPMEAITQVWTNVQLISSLCCSPYGGTAM